MTRTPMRLDRSDVERWLADEGDAGHDAAAEEAFGRVIEALPALAVTGDFVERTTGLAWAARRRRRRIVMLSRAAAVLVFLAAGALVVSLIVGSSGAWIVNASVGLASRSLVWLIVSIATGVDWWSLLVMIGEGVADAMVAPRMTAIMALTGVVGVLSSYALLRLLRGDRFQHPGSVCV